MTWAEFKKIMDGFVGLRGARVISFTTKWLGGHIHHIVLIEYTDGRQKACDVVD